MSSQPQVTVLMAVHNGARYLGEALDGVLRQTFTDFEVVVVDDGSSDPTRGILRCYADHRIRIVENSSNLGLTRSLNIGLDAARGELVARADADDVCEPERLARQIELMNADPRLVLVGSSYTLIDRAGTPIGRKFRDHDDTRLRWIAAFRTPVAHATAMFRRRVDGVEMRYDERFEAAQDYDLWLRLLKTGKGRVIPAALVRYRVHDQNVTHRMRQTQRANLFSIARDNIGRQGIGLGSRLTDIETLLALYHGQQRATMVTVQSALRGLAALEAWFLSEHTLDPPERRWLELQAAGIIGEAVLRTGRGATDPLALATFLVQGFRRLPGLLARALEERRWSAA